MITKKILICGLLVLLLFTGCSETKKNDDASSSSNITENTDLEQAKERFYAFNEKTGLVQQEENEHLKFYSIEEDKQCIQDLTKSLEDNYERVTKDLQVKLDEKVEIYIYPDIRTYHEAINRPDAPDSDVAMAIKGYNIIQMVNPAKGTSFSYEDFMKTIVHEFTHVVVTNMNPDPTKVPLWLDEGIAVYESGQGQDRLTKEFFSGENISKRKKLNDFPYLEDYEKIDYMGGVIGGYQFSYSMVDYIIKTYGFDKFVALVKSYSDFEKVLGVSKENFRKEWINSLN